MPSPDVRRFRWSRAYGLRTSGFAVIALAAVWLLAAVAGFPPWAELLVIAFALVAVGCFARLVLWPPVLLEVSSSGYRVQHARGAGVAAATWAQVQSVHGGTGEEGAVMAISLSDGRSTRVPLGLLGPEAIAAERAVHDRLNAAFGYRRLGNA